MKKKGRRSLGNRHACPPSRSIPPQAFLGCTAVTEASSPLPTTYSDSPAASRAWSRSVNHSSRSTLSSRKVMTIHELSSTSTPLACPVPSAAGGREPCRPRRRTRSRDRKPAGKACQRCRGRSPSQPLAHESFGRLAKYSEGMIADSSCRVASQAFRSPWLKASIDRRAISTFSCDIAYEYLALALNRLSRSYGMVETLSTGPTPTARRL